MENLLLKLKIAQDIQDALKADDPLYAEYQVGNAKSFVASLKLELKKREVTNERVVLRASGPELRIVIRPASRTHKLERMLRKLMMSTDNEKLYEEAMEVLYEK